jgi:branched-chain amino acid aminotransferase
MLYFPELTELDAMRSGIQELLRKLGHRETVYIRPTVYIEEGHYQTLPSELKLGAFVVAFPVKAGAERPPEIRCCVSSWRRTGDLAMPAAIKSGGSYLSFRFAAVEARQNGFDDAILLNERGTVAETTGAAVFAVQHGIARTPPTSAGILDSITRRRVIGILRDKMSVPVTETELSRQDLHTADEIFICGTLAEIRSVVQVDAVKIGGGRAGPITGGVRSEYLRQCMSGDGAPPGWITRVPFEAGA